MAVLQSQTVVWNVKPKRLREGMVQHTWVAVSFCKCGRVHRFRKAAAEKAALEWGEARRRLLKRVDAAPPWPWHPRSHGGGVYPNE